MGFSPDSFSAGEQPTTAKWNKLWSNDQSFNDGTGIGSNAITGDKIASYRVPSQADTTNTTQTAAKVQVGWGQILGNGTGSMTKSVTFPIAITTPLAISINFIGYKSGGSAAAAITEFNTKVGAGAFIEAINLTTTGFTANFSNTGSFGAAYHGYSWIVWSI